MRLISYSEDSKSQERKEKGSEGFLVILFYKKVYKSTGRIRKTVAMSEIG